MPKTRRQQNALDTGKALAAKTLKVRKRAERARAQAVAANPSRVVRRVEASGPSAMPAAAGKHASSGVIVAEGDSWFDYPFHDVLKELEDEHGYDVEAVSHKGDTVEEMAYSGGQLEEFARRIEKVLRSGVRPKAILLSGGGNDIAGDSFHVLLDHAASPRAGLNEDVVNGVLGRLADAYVTILAAVTAICDAKVGERIPIIVHGYDYAIPDGRGFIGGWGFLPGPWLEPGFRQKGYPKGARAQVVRILIDRFNDMLAGIPRLPELKHVTHLDLRKTLSSGPDYKDWWANELHPSGDGFELIAARFAAVIG